MPAVQSKAVRSAQSEAPRLTVADLVLVRIASGGANRADLQRDLAAIFAPAITGTAFRRAAELAIGTQSAQGLITETKGRLAATSAGIRAADNLIGGTQVAKATWEAVSRSGLSLRALGLRTQSAAAGKAIERPDGLAAIVLQQHFGLPLSRVFSLNDLRSELAVVALERAFGNKIKTGLGKGSGLAGGTARLLAGQLFRRPKEFSSDGKLIRALAAEIAGAANDTEEALRLALLRRLTRHADETGRVPNSGITPVAPDLQRAPKPANDATPLGTKPPPVSKPGMSEFAGAVLDAARPISEGWPGNRKAFISRVWQAIRAARREWELSEIAFKTMLAEAHRTGQLVLASADLKDKSNLKDFEDSKILYKNTVWHFVRVED